MAGSSQPIVIEGYTELMRALALLYPELRVATREALKQIVDYVANDAIQWAARQGFAPPGRSGRGTGKLIGSIRSGVTGTMGYVRDSAMNESSSPPYPYPRRYEYQSGGARAFMHPAISQNEGKILASLVAVIDEVSRRFNEGGL